jgi:nicotinamidase-related amidase
MKNTSPSRSARTPGIRRGTSLLIVDVQEKFVADIRQFRANMGCDIDAMIAKLLRRIEWAKQDGEAIMLLEFEKCGPTDERILSALSGYGRFDKATKSTENGAAQVYELCEKPQNRFPTELIDVAGLYEDMCIFHTIAGIPEFYPRTRVRALTDACLAWLAFDWCYYQKHSSLHTRVAHAKLVTVDESFVGRPRSNDPAAASMAAGR